MTDPTNPYGTLAAYQLATGTAQKLRELVIDSGGVGMTLDELRQSEPAVVLSVAEWDQAVHALSALSDVQQRFEYKG